MKGLLAALLLLTASVCHGQDYLDLMSLIYFRTPSAGYDSGSGHTQLSTLDLNLLMPVPLNDRTALLTGLNGLITYLEPAPQSEQVGLYTYALPAGVSFDYGNGWTSSHMLLPRITSAFDQERRAFQFGTAQLIQRKLSPTRSWGFGLYFNTEEQGPLVVPLFSYFYRSPGGKLELNALLPSRADLNIRFHPKLSGGLAFDGLGNSFAMDLAPYGRSYVQRSSNDLSLYLQYPLAPSLLFSVRGGYSFFRSFRIYDAGDTVHFSFMNIFFDDPRTPLNDSIRDGTFFSFRLVYRFYLMDL